MELITDFYYSMIDLFADFFRPQVNYLIMTKRKLILIIKKFSVHTREEKDYFILNETKKQSDDVAHHNVALCDKDQRGKNQDVSFWHIAAIKNTLSMSE